MKKEYDLKKLKKRPGRVRVDKEAKKVAVSLRLDGADLAALKAEAERRGVPYQTFLGSILHQYLHGDLIEKRIVAILKEIKAS
jgi:predicted DNA binding CopG/RHH family protein